MALRNIVLQGEPCLTKKGRPVTEFNARLAQLIDDMKETLVDACGLGLAAPQVGVMRRVCIVVDLPPEVADRAVYSPHLGGNTGGSFRRAHRNMWENVRRIQEGERPVHIVNGL